MFTPTRRAHLISSFGPGALQLSQNGVCGIICGPPVWLESLKSMEGATPTLFENQTILDSHMEHPLGVGRLIAPWPLGDDPRPRSDWFVPAARFPLYEYCVNHACRALTRRDPGDHEIGRCVKCASGKRRKWQTVQVPVVLACSEGHLADIPWSRWIHETGGPNCSYPDDLQFQPGSLSDQPLIVCKSCQRRRVLGREDRFSCGGERPWLPNLSPEQCGRSAHVLERTSTSVYYPTTVSSLAVPPPGVDNPALVQKLHSSSAIRSQRRTYAVDQSESSIEEIVRLSAQLGVRTDAAQVKRHLAALNNERTDAEDRPRELDALLTRRPRPNDGYGLPDLIVEPQDMTEYRTVPVLDLVTSVSLVPRLREVRVLTGFSRIRPGKGSVNYEQLWGHPMPGRGQDIDKSGWLSAYEVFGEGILFQLDRNAVATWEHGIAAVAAGRPLGQFGRPREYLIHTLAHMVMRTTATYAGYPLPSLRERIYDRDERLAFLIYTSAGDIQGTLGGLVELGRPGRLEVLLEEATDRIRWCTTDPVCIEGSIELGLPDTTLAGACHHCLLLPETSCERRNRQLDRAAVVGLDGRGGLRGL